MFCWLLSVEWISAIEINSLMKNGVHAMCDHYYYYGFGYRLFTNHLRWQGFYIWVQFTDTAIWLIVCKALLLLLLFILLYVIIRALMFLYYAVSHVFGTWVWSPFFSEWVYHPQIPFFTTSSYAISNLYNIIKTM